MKRILSTLLACAALAAPALAQQQPKADEQSAQHPAAAAASTAASMAEGEVRKVDKAQSKITLKHGEIKSLDMPPMTMVFQVKDKAWLDRLQPGDKVRFKAELAGGAYLVTAIEPAR
jgi:Cu/Ag efflux protein CusF